MDRKVSTAYLKRGMYISKLDRPWKQTPFLIQGFVIKDEVDIRTLVKYCDYVYIDAERGVNADMYFDKAPGAQLNQRLSTNKQVENILDTGKKSVNYVSKNNFNNFNSFNNKKKSKFIANLSKWTSLLEENNDLTIRCKFNFSEK